MQLIAILAIIFLSIGGILASIVTFQFRKEAKNFQIKTDTLVVETKKLAEITNNILTGGDGYPAIQISLQQHRGRLFRGLNFVVFGDWPLRNVKVKIMDKISYKIDMNENISRGKERTPTKEQQEKYTYYFEMDRLRSDRNTPFPDEILDKIFLKERDDVNIVVTIESENHDVHAVITIYDFWDAENATIATIHRIDNGKQIITKSPNFKYLYNNGKPDTDVKRTSWPEKTKN
ncbi:hypothetical protein [uncultured Croceitalea sp.]|uniref:hypothetical protein n=1 Tax=uncultured Croceitalea sp. TaxID=1798908 RepID=UPI0033068941